MVQAKDIRTKLIDIVKVCTASCNLEETEIIVSGGRGMCKPENFVLIEELAKSSILIKQPIIKGAVTTWNVKQL